MNRVANLPPEERSELFRETGARRNLPAALAEKDFWVCWTLPQLFTMPSLQGHIVLKGGTSLSKVFGAINRFAEDIDLIVDYEMLGLSGDRHPSRGASRSKRIALRAEMLRARTGSRHRPYGRLPSISVWLGSSAGYLSRSQARPPRLTWRVRGPRRVWACIHHSDINTQFLEPNGGGMC